MICVRKNRLLLQSRIITISVRDMDFVGKLYVESFLEYTDESEENFLRCKIISAKSVNTDSGCYKNYAETDELSSPKGIWYKIRVKGGATTLLVLFKKPSTTDKTRFVLVADTQDLEHNGEWWNAVLSDAGKVFPDYD